MGDTDYYRWQLESYLQGRREERYYTDALDGIRYILMADEVITIHRPDIMSPKKKLMLHKMDMTK